jgi:hypothetical protein
MTTFINMCVLNCTRELGWTGGDDRGAVFGCAEQECDSSDMAFASIWSWAASDERLYCSNKGPQKS